jgi:lactate racemase
MKISIKYGKGEELVDVPDKNLCGVAKPARHVEAPADGGDGLVKEALAHPIGTPLLREIARGRRKGAIIITDHSRPTPSGRLLPFVLEELEKGGMGRDRLTVVVASGLHKPTPPDVLENMLGKELLESLTVRTHDAGDEANMVYLGSTRRGTPLHVNRIVAEADLVVSIGVCDPHFAFGWSGGAKNILPGVSARKTVEIHHGRIGTVRAGLDIIEGNDLRDDAEEAGRMAGLSFILNCVLNEKRGIIGAFAGDAVLAHRAAVDLGRRLNVFPVPRPVDVAVCSMGGPPRDKDFWQAESKGLMAVQHAVRDGGIVVLAVGGESGIGTEEFGQMMRASMDEIEQWGREQDFNVPLAKACDLVQYLRRATLFMVSPGLSPDDFPCLPIRFFPSVQEALGEAFGQLGDDAMVLVVPETPKAVISVRG